MNRSFIKFVVGVLVFASLLTGGLSFADNSITVQLDGKTLVFDVQPQIIGGRTMVPLKTIFESLGATVEWNNGTKTVTAYNELYYVEATINDKIMKVNGETKILDIPPVVVNGRTLVPARFVAEAFGAKVYWDAKTSTVIIQSENKVPQNFTDGYEKAVFSKFNSFASDNGLAGTKLYLDCIIDEISIVDTGENIVIVAYLIDDGNNKWIALLNETSLVNEKEYNNVIGKPLIFCATYDGYSTKVNMPFLYLDELYIKETGDVKSGFGKLLSITELETEIEVAPVENIDIYDFTTASGIESYLAENYSSVITSAGELDFNFMVLKGNERASYDFNILVKYDWLQMFEVASVFGNYSDKHKEEAKQQLKDFMKKIADDLISKTNNKKLEGCYYYSAYRYPNLRMDFYTENYCNWTNYDWASIPSEVSPSSFRWRTSLDKERW